jgi:cell division protein FtsB
MKNYSMKKLESRDIIIGVLFLVVLALGWATFFGGDSAYKERVKALEKENKELQAKRAVLDAEIERRKAAFDSLLVVEVQLQSELSAIEAETRLLREEVERSRGEMDVVRERINETRKKIEALKKSPANRRNSDLINSLKLKTQK